MTNHTAHLATVIGHWCARSRARVNVYECRGGKRSKVSPRGALNLPAPRFLQTKRFDPLPLCLLRQESESERERERKRERERERCLACLTRTRSVTCRACCPGHSPFNGHPICTPVLISTISTQLLHTFESTRRQFKLCGIEWRDGQAVMKHFRTHASCETCARENLLTRCSSFHASSHRSSAYTVLAFVVSLDASRLHLSSYTAGSLELQLAGPADASNHV